MELVLWETYSLAISLSNATKTGMLDMMVVSKSVRDWYYVRGSRSGRTRSRILEPLLTSTCRTWILYDSVTGLVERSYRSTTR